MRDVTAVFFLYAVPFVSWRAAGFEAVVRPEVESPVRVARAATVEAWRLEHRCAAARARLHDDRLRERVGLVARVEGVVTMCGHTHRQRWDDGRLGHDVIDDLSPRERARLAASRLDEVVGHVDDCDEICSEWRPGDEVASRVSRAFDDLREVEACRAPVVGEVVRACVPAVVVQTVGNSCPGEQGEGEADQSFFLGSGGVMAARGASDGAALTRMLAFIAAGEADSIAQGKLNFRNVFPLCTLHLFSCSVVLSGWRFSWVTARHGI